MQKNKKILNCILKLRQIKIILMNLINIHDKYVIFLLIKSQKQIFL